MASRSCVTIPSWTELFCRNAVAAERTGDFNHWWRRAAELAQQFGPYCELRVRRAGEDVPLKRYPLRCAHLSRACLLGRAFGVALLRGDFLGKFVPPAEGGRFGEVFLDATVGLPIMCAAVFERLGKTYKKASFKTGKG